MANMGSEIVAFILAVCGWILVCSTLPTDYWKVSSIDGTVITTATYWANLWKTCVTDSTGVSNSYIQVCRGLMIAAVCLGFFGSIIVLVGMKCTKVGGTERTNGKITFCGGISYILSGLSSVIAYSWYANRITAEFFDPLYIEQKYELGAALFIGWAGSSLSILGGAIFCFSLSEPKQPPRLGYGTAASVFSSRTKAYKDAGDVRSAKSTAIPPKQFDKNVYV
ncbi:claudin-10 isoform X2 [Callorhinchus milii]|uniref:claudin-10 isoform X2 n=1 Tax=Callorhinchus milii TaxID=7868 RepID=UPI000457200D|nr:claudin-10 isoform X2 [Callorhinchus milii]|eukprot:gi/632947287/ref/XP_007888974.1/ PREDICTED: claudin-10-like isoform X2 [Callorhinchus milii]